MVEIPWLSLSITWMSSKTADYLIDIGPEGGEGGRNRDCERNTGRGGSDAGIVYGEVCEEIFKCLGQ